MSFPARNPGGFTLIELLTAMAVVMVLIVGLMTMANWAGSTWSHGENQIEKRRNARASTELISRDLRNAILPVAGMSQDGLSNLRFVLNPPANLPPEISNRDTLFWQSSTATDRARGDIAIVGYFVRFVLEQGVPKFRLCRLFIDASREEDYRIYAAATEYEWLSPQVVDAYTSARSDAPEKFRGLLADGVLGIWIRCLDPDGNTIVQTAGLAAYAGNSYDSNLGYAYRDGTVRVSPPSLPASVEIQLVVMDSKGVSKLSVEEAEQIRTDYRTDATAFVNALPDSIRPSARVIRTKIPLPKS